MPRKNTKTNKKPTGKRPERTAIVFVHGQGEQTPMHDLRELIYSVWQEDDDFEAANGEEKQYWSVPNPQVDSNDSRRLTTPHTKNKKRPGKRRRYDFHEFYWADLMADDKLGHVWDWFSTLLNKSEDVTPEHLRPLRRLLFAVTTIIGIWAFGFVMLSSGLILEQDAGFPKFKDSLEKLSNMYENRLSLAHVLLQVGGGAIWVVAGLWWLFKILPHTIAAWWDPSAQTPEYYAIGAKGTKKNASPLSNSWVRAALWLGILTIALTIFPGISQADLAIFMVFGATYLLLLIFKRRVAEIIPVATGLVLLTVVLSLLFIKNQQPTYFGNALVSTVIIYGVWGLFIVMWLQISAEIGVFTKKKPYHLIFGAAGLAFLTYAVWEPSSIKMLILAGLILGVTAALIVLLIIFILKPFVLPVMGDTSSYLSKAPENIHQRQRIQKRGLNLLEGLSNSGKYDRIVILAHSLGSVVAYDVLNAYWGGRHDNFAHASANAALKNVEAKIKAFTKLKKHMLSVSEIEEARENFHKAQAEYFTAISRLDINEPWLIDRFITIGSPLGYGAYLHSQEQSRRYVSDNENLPTNGIDNFLARIQQRELPVCPPITDKAGRVSYKKSGQTGFTPHHSAVFAAVRWENLYFDVGTPNLIAGDIVAGKGGVGQYYGVGIIDKQVVPPKGWEKKFMHTHYWKMEYGDDPSTTPKHITALRKALDL